MGDRVAPESRESHSVSPINLMRVLRKRGKTMKEIWKPIEGFDGYMVSNHGRVNGKRKMLKPSGGTTGYLHVTLFKNGERHTKLVHRLVADAFIPNPNNLPVVNHIDENRANNHVENLEWTTQEGNINFGTRTQRMVETKSRPVIATLPNGTEEYYSSAKEADRMLGFCHVADAIRTGGVRKGRTWRYAE